MKKIFILILFSLLSLQTAWAFNTVNNTGFTIQVDGINANGHYQETVFPHQTSSGWYQDKPMKLSACIERWSPSHGGYVCNDIQTPPSCTVSAHGQMFINPKGDDDIQVSCY